MIAVAALADFVPPPEAPYGPPFDWPAVYAKVGTELPADYRAFCDLYGHGTFHNGWLWAPLTPFAPDVEDDLVATYWRDLLADHPREHRPFPEVGGLLPVAYSELKYTFWWQTGGPPDGWPVLVENDGGCWRRFEEPATEILLRTFKRELFSGTHDGGAF